MPDAQFNFVATVAIPELGIERGDLLRYRARGASHHWVILKQRDFDFGAVLCAMNEGQLEPVDIMPVSALGSAEPPSPPAGAAPPQGDAPPHPALRVLRRA